MLNSLRNNKLLFDTVWFFRRLAGITPESINKSYHKKQSPILIDKYLSQHTLRKLQIGAQSNSISDWLNVDIEPKAKDVAYMDATKPFPFADQTFDYVFSEHMIEHISFAEGQFMIRECYRVLKPGGKIRISTPDLAFLIELYKQPKLPVQEAYIQPIIGRYFKNPFHAIDALVINNFFRDWGHQFIHDEQTLTYILQDANFTHITRCQVNESADAAFQNLEQHGNEIGEQFNKLESIIFEATKQ